MISYMPEVDIPDFGPAFLVWIVTGLIAGWLASRFLGGHGMFRYLVIGMAGAVVGSYLLAFAGFHLPIAHFWIRHIVTATAGAVVVVVLARILA